MRNKLVIGKVLRELLANDKESITAIAKRLKIPKATFFGYLQNVMPRKAEHISILCKNFRVTSDYLLFGHIEDKNESVSELKKGTIIRGVIEILELDK